MYRYILFDLDGTLTDPKEGITKSVQHALKGMGIEEPDPDRLTPFIGPPLGDSFKEFYHMNEEETEQAIRIYRERFSTVGKFENEVYPGIPEMLRRLKGAGARLAVASSKPQVFVEDILEHFDLASCFDVVVGSELSGERVKKEEVVEEAIRRLFDGKEPTKEQKAETAMVGDRKFDVQGARAFGLQAVLVSYGYMSEGEEFEEQPDILVGSVEELGRALLGEEDYSFSKEDGGGEKEELIRRFRKEQGRNLIVNMILPLILYMVISSLIAALVEALFAYLSGGDGSGIASYYETHGADIQGWAQIAAYLLVIPAMYPFYKRTMQVFLDGQNQNPKAADYFRILATAVLSGLLINLIVARFHLAELFPSFQESLNMQEEMHFAVGLLLFGVAAPVTEELIYRGIVYNRLSLALGEKWGLIISAVIFGVLHVYPLQVIYAFLLGLIIGHAYRKGHRLWVPISIHAAVNISVWLLTQVI